MFMVLLISFFVEAAGEVYSSYENVKNINHIENHLVDLLGDYIKQERERLDTLERFQLYVQHNKDYTEPDTYISYPTNQFNVIHRFVADWNNLQDWTNSRNEEISSAFSSYSHFFPDEKDVKGAIKAIHRLQDIYKIRASHFTRGDPLSPDKDAAQGQPFNVKALLLFVKDAYEQEDWHKCAAWGQQAYYQLQTLGEHDPASTLWFDILDHYSFCLYKGEQIQHAIDITAEILEHYPEHERIASNMKYFNQMVSKGEVEVDESRNKRDVISGQIDSIDQVNDMEEVEITFVPKLYPGADQTILTEDQIDEDIQDKQYKNWGERIKKYKKLCKENPPLTPKIKQQIERLVCYYKQDTPRSYLKPIKVEVAWPSPRVLIFYDIINDEEANILMNLAQPHLNRATVHNKNTGKLESAEYRVSKTAWLDNDLAEDTEGIVRRVNRRMEDATELSHDYAELQQVNNYGMAGQYEPHYDMATRDEKAFSDHEGGNRVATLLFYMGKTDAGGATVFIDGGARIAPVQNAAVFWYNLLPNGEPDLLTRHAGCPVLAGTKWVMNKWFHVNDQMFTRPCDLKEEKREKEAKLYDGRYTT